MEQQKLSESQVTIPSQHLNGGMQEFLEEQDDNHSLAASGLGGRSPSPESVSEECNFPSYSSVASSEASCCQDSPMLDEHWMKQQLRMENIEEGECSLSNGVNTDDLEHVLAHHSKTTTPDRAASNTLELKGSQSSEKQKENNQCKNLSRCSQFLAQSTEELFLDDCISEKSQRTASVAEQECPEEDEDFLSASASREAAPCNQSPIFDQEENSGIQELMQSNLGGNNMDVACDVLTFQSPNTFASPSRPTSIGCESECSIPIEEEEEENNDGKASLDSFCSSTSPKSASSWSGDESSDVSEFSGSSANSIDLSDFENQKSSLLAKLFSMVDGPTFQELLSVMHVCEFTLQTKKEKKNQNLRAKLGEAEKEIKQLASQLNESKSVIRMLEGQCNDHETKRKEPTSEIVNLKKDIRMMEVNLEDARTCLKQKDNFLSATESNLAATYHSLEKEKQTCEKLRKELRLANNALSDAKWEAELHEDKHCCEIEDLKNELKIVRREKDELALNLLMHEGHAKNTNKAARNLLMEKNQAVAQCHELQKNWQQCRDRLDQELTLAKAREQDIQNLEKENNKTMAESRQVKYDLQLAHHKISVLEGTLKNNISQHKAMEVEKAELIKTVDKLKRKVDSETKRADQSKEEKDHLDILFKQELLKTRECKMKNQKLYKLAHSRKNKLQDHKVLNAEMGEIKEKVSMLQTELTKEKTLRSQLEEDSRNLKEKKDELEDETRQRDKDFHALFQRLQVAEHHVHSQSQEVQKKKKYIEEITQHYEKRQQEYEKNINILNEAYNSTNSKVNEYSMLCQQKQNLCLELENQLRIALFQLNNFQYN